MILSHQFQRRILIVLGLFLLVNVSAAACADGDAEPESTPLVPAAVAPAEPVPEGVPPPTIVAPTSETLIPRLSAPTPTPSPQVESATTEHIPEGVPTLTIVAPIVPTPETLVPEHEPVAVQASEYVAAPTIATPEPTFTPTPQSPTAFHVGDLTPDLTDTGDWINSKPLTMEDLRSEGKVVLVDFWTYTCVNCIRTLPYLKAWHEKYTGHGLVILGVHTPEFDFEKVYENVVEAVAEFGLEYPIVQDNEYGTWRAFSNRAWPAKYLIDVDGIVRYSHLGEGAYGETEDQIRALLTEAGHDLDGISASAKPEPQLDSDAMNATSNMGPTRELYGGYKRNFGALQSLFTPPYVLHVEYYEATDEAIEYTDPGDHENHFMYLQGLWRNEAEKLVHAQMTQGYEDYIAIKFYGTSVNAVMAPELGEFYEVRVTLDEAPVEISRAGSDIQYDEAGNSYVIVGESRMYFLIDQAAFTGGELKLSSNSAKFSLFAFTFGSYEGGEPVKGND